MATRLKAVSVYLPDELFARVQSFASAEDRTMSQYIARLLERRLPSRKIGGNEKSRSTRPV